MKIVKTISQMQKFSGNARCRHKKIGFVPTMGYLHKGHLSLIRQAKKENDLVVVSIFINPTQFGPKEDFKKYPRNFKKDEKLSRDLGVDVIFFPSAKEMYSKEYLTYVEVAHLTKPLCAAFRPGHFRGVTTICTKLFNAVKPHTAYFGQKDAQQAVVIKKMVEDLNFGFKVKVLPTIRESDGLAMSSRNTYLSKEERKDATCLYSALQKGRNLIKSGCLNTNRIRKEMLKVVRQKRSARIDYISLVDATTLQDAGRVKKKLLIVLAVWIGKTRLIDNIILDKKARQCRL